MKSMYVVVDVAVVVVSADAVVVAAVVVVDVVVVIAVLPCNHNSVKLAPPIQLPT